MNQLDTACHQQSPTHLFPPTTFSLSISVLFFYVFLSLSPPLFSCSRSCARSGFRVPRSRAVGYKRFVSRGLQIKILRLVSYLLMRLLSVVVQFYGIDSRC